MAGLPARSSLERKAARWSNGWAAGGPAAAALCRCPAHDDRSPSLSVRPGRSRLLLHCFAGCDAAGILRALRRRPKLDRAGGTG